MGIDFEPNHDEFPEHREHDPDDEVFDRVSHPDDFRDPPLGGD
jgi:hypothetical protein